jgi:hypothetical protein
MHPITAAVATGAAAARARARTHAVKDTYAVLKWVLRARFPKLEVQVQALEARPASKNKQASLAKELEDSGAGQDADLLALANVLLDAIEREAPRAATTAGVDLEMVKAAAPLAILGSADQAQEEDLKQFQGHRKRLRDS